MRWPAVRYVAIRSGPSAAEERYLRFGAEEEIMRFDVVRSITRRNGSSPVHACLPIADPLVTRKGRLRTKRTIDPANNMRAHRFPSLLSSHTHSHFVSTKAVESGFSVDTAEP